MDSSQRIADIIGKHKYALNLPNNYLQVDWELSRNKILHAMDIFGIELPVQISITRLRGLVIGNHLVTHDAGR